MRKRSKGIVIGLIVLIVFLGAWISSQYTVPILMYHSFDKKLSAVCGSVSLERFWEQMSYIKQRGYRVISLEEYTSFLYNKQKIPHNLVVITFDDGYKDNLNAVKILKKYDFPATIFVVVNKIGQDGYLTEDDIAWFLKHSHVTLGSHTLTHAYLPGIEDGQLSGEIVSSRKELQERFAAGVYTISYPIGGFDHRVLKVVRAAGYRAGCTTNRGFSRAVTPFALRRIKITERDKGIRIWAKLSGYYMLFKRVKNPH